MTTTHNPTGPTGPARTTPSVGGIGALIAAATFIFGIALFVTSLSDYTEGDATTAESVDFLVSSSGHVLRLVLRHLPRVRRRNHPAGPSPPRTPRRRQPAARRHRRRVRLHLGGPDVRHRHDLQHRHHRRRRPRRNRPRSSRSAVVEHRHRHRRSRRRQRTRRWHVDSAGEPRRLGHQPSPQGAERAGHHQRSRRAHHPRPGPVRCRHDLRTRLHRLVRLDRHRPAPPPPDNAPVARWPDDHRRSTSPRPTATAEPSTTSPSRSSRAGSPVSSAPTDRASRPPCA